MGRKRNLRRKRNLSCKEYDKTKMSQKAFKARSFDKGESVFLLFPERPLRPDDRLLQKYPVMDCIVDKKTGFWAGRYNDAKGSHTLISYPTDTNQRAIRKMIAKIDRIFKSFAYDAICNEDAEIIGFKKMVLPYAATTDMRQFYKKRNNWIREQFRYDKKTGKTDVFVAKNIKRALLYGRIILKKEFGMWKRRIIKRDPFCLSVSQILKIVKSKK